jgi:hypothetical protein
MLNVVVFDAGMQSLYLYGHTDGNWVVWQLEELAAPTGKPAPMLGIKLMRRDNTEHLQWLQYIAMHCDAWLIRISFILGANLNAIQRYYVIFIYLLFISVCTSLSSSGNISCEVMP